MELLHRLDAHVTECSRLRESQQRSMSALQVDVARLTARQETLTRVSAMILATALTALATVFVGFFQ